MLKKMISVIVAFVLIFSIIMPVVEAEYWTVLYSWDGTQKAFPDSQVEEQLTVGWYRVWPVEMWASDGRTMLVSGDEVELYESLNWYINEEYRMYIIDSGKLIYTPIDARVIYQNHNWYSEEPIVMYDGYGRELYVSRNYSEEYKNLNWFYTEPELMWAEDGRTLLVEQYEIELYKSLGWNSYNEHKAEWLYALDGREILVKESEVSRYLKLGWYKWEDMNYINFKNETDSLMASMDYEGVYGCCDRYMWTFDDTKYMDEFYNVKYRAREAWRKQAGGAPLVFTGYQNMDGDTITFGVRNVSYKNIIAVKVDFDCYDIFGYLVDWYYGIEWGRNRDLVIETDERCDFSCSGISRDTYRIGNINIREVVFSDGTMWTNY